MSLLDAQSCRERRSLAAFSDQSTRTADVIWLQRPGKGAIWTLYPGWKDAALPQCPRKCAIWTLYPGWKDAAWPGKGAIWTLYPGWKDAIRSLWSLLPWGSNEGCIDYQGGGWALYHRSVSFKGKGKGFGWNIGFRESLCSSSETHCGGE